MYKNKKILGLIPARSGSKRIKNKNIKPLKGQPLIYYTIKQAQQSKFIDKIIVSTDSAKIANITKKMGAEIPFLRPKKLAGDKVTDLPVIKHCLDFLKQQKDFYDYIVYLRPTSPLRIAQDIDKTIKTIHKTKLPIIRSVTRAQGIHHPYWMYKIKDNFLTPLLPNINIKQYYQSQLLPTNIVYLNGVVDAFTCKHILTSDFLYGTDKIGYIEIPPERAIDIDNELDFKIAECLMRNLI